MSAFSDSAVPAEVLARARAGEEAAHAQIYLAFERPVRTLARRLLAHRASAEDVAQDVFVDVLTRLHQFEGRGSFAGWVRTIVVTRCLMQLRSPWHRSRRWLSRVGDDGQAEDALDEVLAASLDAVKGDVAAAIDLERGLSQLGDTARTVVWLHDVEGYTHAEIGALYGASASFSKSQLARAHERLREALQPAGGGSPCIPAPSTY